MQPPIGLKPGFNKRITLALIAAVLVTAGVVIGYQILANKNPLPQNIKQQLTFPAIYPAGSLASKVDPGSISYRPSQKTLSYTINNDGTDIILSEQSAPGNSPTSTQAYYQSLGLTPVTEIQTKLGLVALVNFYVTTSFNSVGQNAVLADNGTLLIAHPSKNIDPESWKAFFNSLDLYK